MVIFGTSMVFATKLFEDGQRDGAGDPVAGRAAAAAGPPARRLAPARRWPSGPQAGVTRGTLQVAARSPMACTTAATTLFFSSEGGGAPAVVEPSAALT